MPLIHTIQTATGAKVGIWRITEPEEFFTGEVRVEREVHHPHKRLQHLAARYLLHVLEPSFPLDRIRISASGKPYLPGHSFFFSLSHSGDYAASIVSGEGPSGVDVERISSKAERVKHKFLRPEELSFISPSEPLAHLTLCWCVKEAVFKWYGGPGIDFREDIRLAPFPLLESGSLQAAFRHGALGHRLTVEYTRRESYQLAWVTGHPA